MKNPKLLAIALVGVVLLVAAFLVFRPLSSDRTDPTPPASPVAAAPPSAATKSTPAATKSTQSPATTQATTPPRRVPQFQEMTPEDFQAWQVAKKAAPAATGRTATGASDPRITDEFIRGQVVTDDSGRIVGRTAIVRRPDFKYPLVRIEQQIDPATGATKENEMVADHIMVRVKPGVSDAQLTDALAQVGAAPSKRIGRHVQLVSVPTDRIEDFQAVVGTLSSRADIATSASPDFIVHTQLTPNDSDYGQQWGLHNTGQSSGTADADIDAPEAWDIGTGVADNIVAVIDTGIDYTHPDLATNMWKNVGETGGGKETNGVDDDGNGYIDDVYGWNFANDTNDPMDDHYHGTHCAGVIGARSNNGSGIAGVNWNVQMMALKFLNSQGSGAISDALLCFAYAIDKGVKVSSNSWGGGGYSAVFVEAIQDAVLDNHLFVFAAGNDGNDTDVAPVFPGAYGNPNILTIAATDRKDALASFSTYGEAGVDMGAPGVTIYSTTPVSENGTPTYRNLSGTSMAAPHVAGAAALLRSKLPGLSYDVLKTLLMDTGDSIPGLAGKTVSGKRLNLFRAFQTANDGAPLVSAVVDDDGVGGTVGNGNAIAEPGETVDLVLGYRNPWNDPITITSVTASESSGDLSITQQPVGGSVIAPGATVAATSPVRIVVAANATTPIEHPITLTLSHPDGTPWTKTVTLGVFRGRTVQGKVTLDGVGVAGATVNFAAAIGGSATTDANGNYTFLAIDTIYSVFATMPGATRTPGVTVNGATQTAPVNFAFSTRTVSGVVRDSVTNAPVTTGRLIYLLLDTVEGAAYGEYSQYFSTYSAADGTYSFTYIFGNTPRSSLYLLALSPHWTYFDSFTLSSSLTKGIILQRSGIALFPTGVDVTAQAGTTVNVPLTITPQSSGAFYMTNLRLENGRPEDVGINPYPGTPVQMIEEVFQAGPLLTTDNSYYSFATHKGKFYRLDG